MKKLLLILLTFLLSIGACNITAYAASTTIKPVTQSPIVLDSDRAILLGTTNNTGSERGFYYGTASPNTKVLSRKIVRSKMNVLITGLKPSTAYYFQAYVKKGKTVYKGSIVSFTTPKKKQWTASDPILSTSDERYKFIFGTTTKYYKISSPAWGYNSAVEAKKHMVTITVPIWKLSHGKKIASTRKLTIHYKLKANVAAIFKEIYALNIKFPITYLTGYSYRRMVIPWVKNNPYLSQHSFGTCIDINRYQNQFYRYKDKRNKKSSYYIPESVIQIFEKYGWSWGGDFKEGLDTMHFQYLGIELTK
jgi:hypothetical protein